MEEERKEKEAVYSEKLLKIMLAQKACKCYTIRRTFCVRALVCPKSKEER